MYIYGVNVDARTLTAYQAAYKLYISISIHRKMKNSIGNVRKKGRA